MTRIQTKKKKMRAAVISSRSRTSAFSSAVMSFLEVDRISEKEVYWLEVRVRV
jgi:hypothetical protein